MKRLLAAAGIAAALIVVGQAAQVTSAFENCTVVRATAMPGIRTYRPTERSTGFGDTLRII